ncbi:SDR family NAD(P)-dependent oxidoreductase [Marinigracilibium pacificum]|uniref:SDR family oxidoreductase n=1 Tax=Marinigracilibium pacificum TaxID=2729599 RepID=A0A848IYF6_9BACT|nr:SDR family oxidoreductase [Marinigracilibium pacificum]NMM47019.1 SDR family oxidoreductase [Marinigracilibium pacificum]
MHLNLIDQHIFVTGGSRGIGLSIVSDLLNSGAFVSSVSTTISEDLKGLKKEYPENLNLLTTDLSNTNEIKQSWSEAINFRTVTGLVNNAGIAFSSDLLKENDNEWLAEWDKTFAVNTRAVAYLCKLAIELFISTGEGRIINISSRAAYRGDTAEYLAYGASKGALVSLTKSIARAYGKQGIKAFEIAPGFTRTDMAQDFIDQYGEDYALNDIALKKLTTPEDISPTVVFLLSGKADHLTGTSIDINAGSYVH